MKKLMPLFALIFTALSAQSQVSVPVEGSPEYDQQKLNGTLGSYTPAPTQDLPGSPVWGPGGGGVTPQSGCGCYIEPDATWNTLNLQDDASSSLISLPFTFCFYGQSDNSLYINANGNVTFNSPLGTYSPPPLPSNGQAIIGAFWADVDMNGGTIGNIRYKITSTAIYINWVNVGYFNDHGDKRNTFSIILTNGNDPIIGTGNNVAFCYKDMQWTSGDVTGANGFGGPNPATVGANWGNGSGQFNLFGIFNQPGGNFYGPNNANNGIDWLDNKSFKFNVCNNVNLPPALVNAVIPGYTYQVDTCNAYAGGVILPNGGPGGICTGQSVSGSLTFTGPESAQSVALSISGPAGLSSSLTSGSGTYTINWTYTPTPGTQGPQTFTVTATDNGTPPQTTVVNFTLNVTVPPYQPSISGPDSICPGSTAILYLPQSWDTYNWTGAATGTSPTIQGPYGTYNVTVTYGGCTLSTSKTVYPHVPPTPVITGNTQVCPGQTTPLATTLPYTGYQWSNGDTNAITNVGAGTYTVTVTDNHYCPGTSASFTVTAYQAVTPNTAVVNVSCNGLSDGEITVSVPGATGSETISWAHDPNLTSFTATGLAAGTYNFIFTDANGCPWQGTAAVTEPAPLQNTITPTNVTCPGGSDGAAQVTSTGGTPQYTYTWTNDGGNISDYSTGYAMGTYGVTVTDANGCSETLSFTLTELSSTPALSATSQIESCPGAANGSLDLTVNGGNPYFSYLWSNGDTNEDPQGLAQGNYSVTVTDANGCPFNGSFTVGVGAQINLNSNVTDVLCNGDLSGSLIFLPQTGIAPFTVTLNGNPGSMSNVNLPAGVYATYITDVNGCWWSDTLTITEPPVLTVDSVEYNINLGDVINIPIGAYGGVPPYVYSWTPPADLSCTNCTQPTCTAVNTTVYTIEVTDAHGCISLGKAIVNVSQLGPFIPAAFTPNDDGVNDVFNVMATGLLDFNLKIFDRWGSVMYESDDLYNGWNGKIGGKEKAAPVGTYVYRITGTFINGKDLDQMGSINLIR